MLATGHPDGDDDSATPPNDARGLDDHDGPLNAADRAARAVASAVLSRDEEGLVAAAEPDLVMHDRRVSVVASYDSRDAVVAGFISGDWLAGPWRETTFFAGCVAW